MAIADYLRNCVTSSVLRGVYDFSDHLCREEFGESVTWGLVMWVSILS